MSYRGDKLQGQNWVKFDFKVKFDLAGQGWLPPKTIGILTKVFCTFGSNLVVLPCHNGSWVITWTKKSSTHTHRHQATTIPESQNWPWVKIRWSWDCLIFITGITILVRHNLYTWNGPLFYFKKDSKQAWSTILKFECHFHTSTTDQSRTD